MPVMLCLGLAEAMCAVRTTANWSVCPVGGTAAVADRVRRPSSLIGSESSMELSSPGERTKVPESESSHGANVLCLELSLQGAKVQGNEKSIIPAV